MHFPRALARSLLLVSVGYVAALATPAFAGSGFTEKLELVWSVLDEKSGTLKGHVAGTTDVDVTFGERGKNLTVVTLSPGGESLCSATVPNGTPIRLSASKSVGETYTATWLGQGKQLTATRTLSQPLGVVQ